jgi:hypothetical protein
VIELAIVLGFFALCLSFVNLRYGMVGILLVGCFQDPVRKLTPGQPVVIVVSVLVIFGVALLGAVVRGVRLQSGTIAVLKKRMNKPLGFFVLFLGLSVTLAVAKTGNVMVAGIGLMSYFAPFPAILLGHAFLRKPKQLLDFIQWYVILVCLMLSGVYLYLSGVELKILEPVGEWLDVYTSYGASHLLPGFFRSSENAAWHGSAGICLTLMTMVSGRQSIGKRWTSGLVVAYLFGAVLLTGRRKALAEVIVFLTAYAALLFFLHRGAIRVVQVAGVTIVGGILGLQIGLFQSIRSTAANPYLERGQSVFSEGIKRITDGIQSFGYVIARNGLLGSGAGTGSQGSQYFGGGLDIVGGSAETGPAKVLAELGVPGVLLLLWLASKFARFIWKALRTCGRDNPEQARTFYGLVSFVAANVTVFFTAHQVFGDPFVLLLLGIMIGFVLAVFEMRPAAKPAPLPSRLVPERPSIPLAAPVLEAS